MVSSFADRCAAVFPVRDRYRLGIRVLMLLLVLGALSPLEVMARDDQAEVDRAAFQRLRRAAQRGDVLAQVNTGALYYHGIGVNRQYAKAFFWFLKAARAGNAWGQFNAGSMYQYGLGTAKNYEKAAYWFDKVANMDPRVARYNPIIRGWARLKMALMYLEGRGVPRDERRALDWFGKTADEGFAQGQYWMGRMKEEGRGVSRDPVEALAWYDMAAAQGSRDAEKARRELSRKMVPAKIAEARRRVRERDQSSVGRLIESLESGRSGDVPFSSSSGEIDAAQPPDPFPEGPPRAKSVTPVEPPPIVAPRSVGRSEERSSRFALTVLVTPPEARVRILNIVERYRPGMRLQPGLYRIEADLAGYRTKRQWVELENRDLEVSLELEPEPSAAEEGDRQNIAGPRPNLTVIPMPVDATVRILNILPRYRPGISLRPGRYHLEVSHPRYESVSRWITLEKGHEKVFIELTRRRDEVQPEDGPEEPRIEAASRIVAEPGEGAVESSERSADRFGLTVLPTPADARVRVMNIRPPYRPGMRLKPGPYRIRVSRPGHQTEEVRVILSDRDLAVNVDLKRSAAVRYGLTVHPTPVDARVRVLNIVPPYRPGIRLAPGSYHIEVSKEGFEPKKRWVNIVHADRDVSIELKPRFGGDFFSLTVRSTPADATVRLLNIRPTYRPGMNLEPGSYHVEVSKPGYHTQSRWVELGHRDLEVPFVLQKRQEGPLSALTVLPTLAGARVRVLNIAAPYRPGITLRPGRYHVEVSKPGFKTERRWVDLGEKNLNIPISLEELNSDESGVLFVNTWPGNARVRILNIDPPYRPGMRLEPGRYLIEVVKEGFRSEKQWVEVGTGVTNLPVKLKPAR